MKGISSQPPPSPSFPSSHRLPRPPPPPITACTSTSSPSPLRLPRRHLLPVLELKKKRIIHLKPDPLLFYGRPWPPPPPIDHHILRRRPPRPPPPATTVTAATATMANTSSAPGHHRPRPPRPPTHSTASGVRDFQPEKQLEEKNSTNSYGKGSNVGVETNEIDIQHDEAQQEDL